ncbi:MAG: PqqD family peptide modification chaperone [Anaerolineales bacterium]|nr:PqqD family peptide modification chaperone [Anaerolineales bacterium]
MTDGHLTPTFTLDVNGVRIGIVASGLSIVSELKRRYRSFISMAEPKWFLTLAVNAALPKGKAPKASISHTDTKTSFWVDIYKGEMDFGRCRAVVSVPNSPEAISGLERVAAYICMQELHRHHSSLLLHGAGLVVDDVGYAFFGASGRGKSTISRLAAGFGDVLSDELVIVDVSTDQAVLVSTPFWGTGTPTDRVASSPQRRVPLQALYDLHHGSEFRVETLSAGAAIMALLASEKVAIERVSNADSWLAIARKVVNTVPIERLQFYPSTDLWEYLSMGSFTKGAAMVPIMHHNPQVSSRLFDGEAVLVDTDKNVVRMLNEVGSRIWELVDGERSAHEIAEILSREYDVSLSEAQVSVNDFLVTLAAHELIAEA